jgi:hypothetical protein
MMSTKRTFSEFADDQHQAQAEEFMLEFGRFGIAFERVCEGMRSAIIDIFHSEGLKHQGLSQVVIGDKASAELQVLLGALFTELRARTDEDDQKAVRELLKEVKELTEARNTVIHSAWQFGRNAAFAEMYATSVRPRTKQTKGAVPELHGVSANYLRQLTDRCKQLQIQLRRVQYSVAQSGFKVATELAKPL